ncbi:MAG: amidase family protein [Gammaproteobacteria bacterium]|nr:amidase family protein [Gammaproteobacteria bacterium]
MDSDLTALTATQLAEVIDSGTCSAREAVQAFLDRIDAVDRDGPALNAMLEVNPTVMEIACQRDGSSARGDERGPLHGVPIVLKANIDTGDAMATSAGSLALANHRAVRDAPLVARLRAAGAILLGKTNLSEWANFRSTQSISGWSSIGGQTRNPYVRDRSPSGSSSGSAVAVAARLAPLSVGTETDGSIVSPAGACGVVGIKPTVGAIDREGIVPIAASTDTAGPFANNVSDAVLLLDALSGTSTAPSRSSLKGARVGVLRHGARSHAGVAAALGEAVDALSGLGAHVVEGLFLDLPDAIYDAEYQLLLHEFKDGLNRYLAGHDTGLRDLASLIAYNEAHADVVMPLFGQEHFEAAQATEGLDCPAYRTAVAQSVDAMREAVDCMFRKSDLRALIAATNGPAWKIGESERGHISSSSIAAVSGYPSIAVPWAWVDGLPVAVSFIGLPHSEAHLVGVAMALEEARGTFPAPEYSLRD